MFEDIVYLVAGKINIPLPTQSRREPFFHFILGGGDFLAYRVDLLTDLARCR